jgi:pimeloyl-ACP methyl ester carboxylesterase
MQLIFISIIGLLMTSNTIAQQNFPKWLDQEEYPFSSNSFQSSAGMLNYVDVGKGDPIVMVHGNPGWSFEYRNVIKGMMAKNRCIAPDMIGFGFSDKPYEWDYLPKSHAAIFEEFMDSLNLNNITLVVNDWGGPIGLSYAIKHPEKIKKLVILNTFLWSVKDDPYYQKFSKRAGGGMGRFLIKNYCHPRKTSMILTDNGIIQLRGYDTSLKFMMFEVTTQKTSCIKVRNLLVNRYFVNYFLFFHAKL